MDSRTQCAHLRRWLAGFGAALMFACPAPDTTSLERAADLPTNAASASLEMTTVVPQGDWELWIRAQADWDVTVRSSPSAIEDLAPGCAGWCGARQFALHCPRGKCRFDFDIAVTRFFAGTAAVTASIPFAAADGCAEPNPREVAPEDVERLFAINFSVRDVVLAPDAGTGTHASDAGDAGLAHDAGATTEAGALDAEVAQDAGSTDDAPAREAGPLVSARGSMIDARDGQRYATVTLGRQTWMAQSLNYGAQQISYRQYTVPVDDGRVEKYCLGDDPEQCRSAGGLYSWPEALALPATCVAARCAERIATPHRGICPAGWHIPSDAEWTELALHVARHLAIASSDVNDAWPAVAGALKSTSAWPAGAAGSDDSGFGALPTSDWVDDESETGLMKGSLFHSSEEQTETAVTGPALYERRAGYSSFGKQQTTTVRCVQDRAPS